MLVRALVAVSCTQVFMFTRSMPVCVRSAGAALPDHVSHASGVELSMLAGDCVYTGDSGCLKRSFVPSTTE